MSQASHSHLPLWSLAPTRSVSQLAASMVFLHQKITLFPLSSTLQGLPFISGIKFKELTKVFKAPVIWPCFPLWSQNYSPAPLILLSFLLFPLHLLFMGPLLISLKWYLLKEPFLGYLNSTPNPPSSAHYSFKVFCFSPNISYHYWTIYYIFYYLFIVFLLDRDYTFASIYLQYLKQCLAQTQ